MNVKFSSSECFDGFGKIIKKILGGKPQKILRCTSSTIANAKVLMSLKFKGAYKSNQRLLLIVIVLIFSFVYLILIFEFQANEITERLHCSQPKLIIHFNAEIKRARIDDNVITEK